MKPKPTKTRDAVIFGAVADIVKETAKRLDDRIDHLDETRVSRGLLGDVARKNITALTQRLEATTFRKSKLVSGEKHHLPDGVKGLV